MTERKPLGMPFESWIDRQIRDAIRTGLSGPPLNLMPFDVDEIVSEWRRAQR
ncbi:hypothetical protein AB0L65_15765 [Nonomuraea sp. NPDC052116]|uniref:hypothetical protein n=1 Tax=Nonomuraea sp. NPDC052116 TaxID=3155665 RepID=UPI00343437E2